MGVALIAMTADHYLTVAACVLGISACVRWWIAERRARQLDWIRRRLEHEVMDTRDDLRATVASARWRIVRVDTAGRGPNADTFYHVPPNHEGRELWLTDEQVLGAKLRPDTTAKRTYETP